MDRKKISFKKYFSVEYLALLLFIIFAFLILPQSIKEISISNHGDIIKAEIIKMPERCSEKYIFAEFQFSNHKFTKRVWKSFCKDHEIGELVEFYYMEKYPEDFVFKIHKETALKAELISTILLVLLFASTAYYLFFEK